MTSKSDRQVRALILGVIGLVVIGAGILAPYLVLIGFRSDAIGLYIVAGLPTLAGSIALAIAIVRLLPDPAVESYDHRTGSRAVRKRAALQIVIGIAAILAGCSFSKLSYDPRTGADLLIYAITFVPVVGGAVLLTLGLFQFRQVANSDAIMLEYVPKIGYRSFVAWRYLLNRQHRISPRTKLACVILLGLRIVLWLAFGVGAAFDPLDPLHQIAGGAMGALAIVAFWGILRHSRLATTFVFAGFLEAIACVAIAVVVLIVSGALADSLREPLIDPGEAKKIAQAFVFVGLGAAVLASLAWFFGTLRGFFTFFTTVPIGGVWIGTAALVVVLAVMSGFESDLRDKILGSNAHIQVTKEDGDFVDWREAKAKIDKIPGVVASTPYAVSEVVIAANNNGMNVIIKGIDPKTVAHVTDLVDDLRTFCPSPGNSIPSQKDPEAMARLAPLIKPIRGTTTVAPQPLPDDTIDPPPDDMVRGGDPIDFSGSRDEPSPDAGAGDVPPADAPPVPAGDPDHDRVEPYGGDAVRIIDLDTDHDYLPDSDLIRWAIGEDDSLAIHAVDLPSPDPLLSRRTQALPGILVGCELVKQTHLYTGEEVRVVSPLSDPSNPDATGTPIPFNRDYRIAGMFYTGMYEYDLKFVYVTLDSLQDFLDLGDTVDGIEVRVSSADDTDNYVPSGDNPGLIRKALGPGYRVQDWRELNRSLFSALKLEKIAMFLVLGIVILVASFSIIGNLIMVVVEKGREIALIKTLGASDTGVMQLFAIQGLIIGIIGTALGVTMGLMACSGLEQYGLPLDPDVYYINRLPIHVDTQSVIAAAFTGVLISIAATLYPALMAARVHPADGMRH